MGIDVLRQSDLKALNKLNQQELGYSYPLEKASIRFKHLITDTQHHLLIGYRDQKTGEVVGYVHAELYEELYCDPLFNILALAVSKNFQKQGIGKMLLDKVEKEAKNRGLSGIRLNSGTSRVDAHAFYNAVGYSEVKTQKKFQKTWE